MRRFLACIAAALIAVSGAASAAEQPPTQGSAVAYDIGPFTDSYHVDAKLALPAISSNRSWYCVWLMLLRFDSLAGASPFVQGGLIRWAANGYRVTSFFASQRTPPMRYGDIVAVR